MIAFPKNFTDRLIQQYPETHSDILSALNLEPVISVRSNPKKHNSNSISNAIPWAPLATYLGERPNYVLDPLFHSGCYYPQEASSMILGEVLPYLSLKVKPRRILDLCAAPGGKSTHLLSLIDDESVLVSNEIVPKRYSILKENLFKWGHPNFITTNYRPDVLQKAGAIFDIVLVDAPCSGEGLFRKQPDWRNKWTTDNCQQCSTRQHQILDAAKSLVRPGGYIIYSTCTINPDENIGQINHLIKNYDFSSVPLDQLLSFNFIQEKLDDALGYLALPNRVQGEPFFIACVKRDGDETPILGRTGLPSYSSILASTEYFTTDRPLYRKDDAIFMLNSAQLELSKHLQIQRLRYSIPSLGHFKKALFLPDHFSAMNTSITKFCSTVSLSRSQALSYLRHENLDIVVPSLGWHILTFKEIPMGWIKYDGRRIINKYPMKWRLRQAN